MLDRGKAQFFDRYPDVPRGTSIQLERYAELLIEWNEKFNLVAASSLDDLWVRHFLDSAQLLPLLKAGEIVDLGSGAGFPGLVLAVMSGQPVHLVESIGKKANFLRHVVTELKLDNVQVHQQRIETLYPLKGDMITARALKALPELLTLAKPLMKQESFCLFLKGQRLAEELTEAQKCWKFNYATRPSLSDPSGSVIKIEQLFWNKQAAAR